MSPQFYLDNFYIDCSRNLVIQQHDDGQQKEQNLPPKTIEVLFYLASRQGEVVSVDELLDRVWPETVVSNNSLQRCIAQLRKAFGDDSKKQAFIKTHAKRGYSLEVAVFPNSDKVAVSNNKTKPHLPTNEAHQHISENSTDIPTTVATPNTYNITAVVVFSLLLITVIGFYLHDDADSWQYNKLTPLTSHDKKETNPLFSPDDKYITFHRYDGMCANNIWAKDLSTEREYQLTQSTGFYGAHTFAEQGSKIAFMAKNNCSGVSEQRACWSLMTIDFQQALNSPQVPQTVATCDDGKLSSPVWLDNQAIAVLRTNEGKTRVAKYQADAPDATDIYSPDNLTLYHLLQTENRQQIAALAFDQNNQQQLIWLDNTGQLLEQFPIQFPESIAESQLLDARYDVQGEQFIFSLGNTLYALNYQGQISKLSTLAFNHIFGVQKANKHNRLTASQGFVDADIAMVNINNQTNKPLLASELNQTVLPYPSISRSTFNEQHGQFQPKGQAIAFYSDRTGEQQLWLQNSNNDLTKLTKFNSGDLLSRFVWSPNGDSMLLAKNGVLTQVFLDKSEKTIALNFPVTEVYQWTDKQQLLIKVRLNGQLTLIKLNLKDLKPTVLLAQEVLWAQLANNGVLYYLDAEQQIWQLQLTGASPVTPLRHQVTGSVFLMQNNDLIGINGKDELWRYQMFNDKLERLTTVAPQFTRLSDIKDNLVLGTQIASSRKDIVLLEHTKQ